MLNSLTTATDGYLCCATKKLLVIAVAGYLNFCGVPPPTPTGVDTFVKKEFVGGGKKFDIQKEQEESKRVRLLMQDDEILNIIKIWVECQG